MKRNFSRVFCLGLVMLIVLLSGCGTEGEKQTENIDGTVPTPSAGGNAKESESPAPAGDFPPIVSLGMPQNSGFLYGNIINGGTVAESQGQLFYRSSVDKKLYGEGEAGKLLVSDYPFDQAGNILFSINAIDGWVYFLQEPAQGVFKVRADGSEKTKLIDEYCEYLYVADGFIYFKNIDDKLVYKAGPGGENSSVLFEDRVGCFCLVDGYIFYTEEYYLDSRLYRVRTDGTDKELIFPERCDRVNVDGDRLFVIRSEDNTVWSMKSNGSDARMIEGVIARNMNVADGWIYFGNLLEGEKLYKVKTDGSGMEKLSDMTAASISLTKDWIYFDSYRISRSGGEPETVQ
ncbi:MAG: DUF5050 domain-containing protein [Clostridia bacterium]|nr:DUF5050 domain-containing protein [Clostridia bacterium]